jgi:RNA polymerase sigma-70 factor (ECF subfamily)
LLQEKNKKGFMLLYDFYSKALYCIILKVVHDTAIAEDVLQESYIKIWKNFSSYDATKGSLFTWLLNIARNTAIDYTRSNAYKKETRACSLESVYSAVDNQLQTESLVEDIGIKRCISELKAEHQQLIEYIYVKGYTQEQASNDLHIPLGTVKSRVRSAVKQLKILLI